MKYLFYILFIINSLHCYSQVTKFDYSNKDWTPSEFPSAITNVKAYEYKVKKNGKVKRDSILLYDQSYDADKHTVSGKNYFAIFTFGYNDKVGSNRTYYRFTNKYDSKGSLVNKAIKSSKDSSKKNSDSQLNNTEIFNEFDDRGNLISEETRYTNTHYTLGDRKNDTISTSTSTNSVFRFFNYQNDNCISVHVLEDSTKTTYQLNSHKITKEKSYCYGCHPKYKSIEKTYNEQNLNVIETWYTKDSKIHSKRYSYYDDKARIIKEIDSTGWYINKTEPYKKSETTYVYNDSGKIVTKIDYQTTFLKYQKTVATFNTEGLLLNECITNENNIENCEYTEYIYNNNLIIKAVQTNCNGQKMISYFKHNSLGLPIEKRDTFKGKTFRLIRYFYQ